MSPRGGGTVDVRGAGRALARAATLSLAALAASVASSAGAESLADPTRPPMVGPAQPEAPEPVEVDWRLVMVRVSGAARSAVLNGALVREGDTLDGARVARIEPGSVTLEAGGRRTVVALVAPLRKRPSDAVAAPAPSGSLKRSPDAPLQGVAAPRRGVGEADRAEDASAGALQGPGPKATTEDR